MLSPVVKRHTPRVGAVVGTKAGELAGAARNETSHCSVDVPGRRLNLAVVENGFAKNQIAIRTHTKSAHGDCPRSRIR